MLNDNINVLTVATKALLWHCRHQCHQVPCHHRRPHRRQPARSAVDAGGRGAARRDGRDAHADQARARAGARRGAATAAPEIRRE